MPAAPQIPRLLRLIDELEAPVVEVLGWPGSGRAALLAALLDRDTAVGLAPEALASEAAAGEAVRAAVRAPARAPAGRDGGVLLVCPGRGRGGPLEGKEADKVLRALTEAVPAGARLVVATAERPAAGNVLRALVTPRELALRPDEVAALWREETGGELSPEEVRRWAEWSDGWWRVLVLAARAATDGGPVSPDGVASLIEIPAVADFLRLEVLAELGEEERAALADLAGAPADVVWRLTEGRGLLLDGTDGRLRPPAPLAALLARERQSARGRTGVRRQAPAGLTTPASSAGPTGSARSEEAPVARFRLRLLGHPEVDRLDEDGTWQPVRFTLKRGLRMLAYLATSAERSALREELVEAVWPEEDREVIERNFHPTLSHLRRNLRGGATVGRGRDDRAELLLYHDGLYTLDPRVEWWIDGEELVRLVEEGEALATAGRDAEAVERWQAAWRLYRGPLLEGTYDPWAVRRRERIQRRHLGFLLDLGRTSERLGRADEALDAYRALLVDDPLEEKVHVALMGLYAARGRRDLVRRQYERLSLLLRTELGIEPMPETADEYHRLMIERG